MLNKWRKSGSLQIRSPLDITNYTENGQHFKPSINKQGGVEENGISLHQQLLS